MATRFRLTSDATAPAVSPAIQTYTHDQGTRRKLLLTDASALTTSAYTPDAADDLTAGDSHHVQFVSAPLTAGAVFTSGDELKFAIQCLEPNAGNNLRVQIFVSVVDSAGTTVQATLRSKINESLELAGSIINRFMSTTLDGSYTLVANDRLVVEWSLVGTPTAAGGVNGHNGSFRWGSDGAGGDLPENDTETGTTVNPWVEFFTTVTEAGAGAQNLTGTLFTKTPTFFTGAVTSTRALTGTLFTKAPTFPTGVVTASYALTGTLFTKAPTFFTGTVTAGAVTLTGTLFQNTPTFPTGAVSLAASPQTLNGVLFTKAPTFPQGAVTATYALTGTLFAKAPSFFTGTVTSGGVTLTGVLFTQAPTFFTGTITAGAVTLTGVLFQNTPTFPTGTVTAGTITLSGVLFQSTPTFPTGTIGQAGTLFGTLFVKAPTFFTGTIAQGAPSFWITNPAGYTANPVAFVKVGGPGPSPWGTQLSGRRFEKAPTFPVGTVT